MEKCSAGATPYDLIMNAHMLWGANCAASVSATLLPGYSTVNVHLWKSALRFF